MNWVLPVTGLVAQPTAAPAAAMPVSAMKRRRVRPEDRSTGIPFSSLVAATSLAGSSRCLTGQ